VQAARDFARSLPQGSGTRTLTPGARVLLRDAARRAHLSGRAVTRLVRVARTIANLESSRTVREEHIGEALGYRAWEPS